jgi:ACS family hexuronate transporter-like MFS transporter
MGIINAGSAVGAVMAPPGIAFVIATWSWRWVFLLSGAVGLLWTLWWSRTYFVPPRIAQTEASAGISWLRLFTYRQVWGLVMAKFLSDAAWYFYIFWLPKYLYDVRGFDTRQVGYFAWIPYAASGVGSLCGGWFSSRLLRSGCSLDRSRKFALGASAGLMPLIFFVTQAPVQVAILLFSIAFFGQQSWSTLVMILPADLFPHEVVGSVAGLVGFGGAMGGFVFGLVVGYLLDHGFGYGTVFPIVSTMHVIAFGVILLTVRKVAPVAAFREKIEQQP